MLRTLVSPGHVVSPSLQPAQFFVVFNSPESTAPQNGGWISGDLAFPATNKAMRAVKGPEEGNESHGDLTRYSGKALVTKNTFLYRV